jgi:hypothetical protein
LSVLEESDCIGDDRANAADRAFLPNLKASLKLITVNDHIVVDDEEHLCLAFRRYFVPPVHRIAGSLQEVDWSFPAGFVEYNWRLVRLDFIIPDDVEVGCEGTVDGCVALNVALDDSVVLSPGVRDCDESETA